MLGLMRHIPLPLEGAVRRTPAIWCGQCDTYLFPKWGQWEKTSANAGGKERHTSATGGGSEGPANFTTAEVTLILECCTARVSAQSKGLVNHTKSLVSNSEQQWKTMSENWWVKCGLTFSDFFYYRSLCNHVLSCVRQDYALHIHTCTPWCMKGSLSFAPSFLSASQEHQHTLSSPMAELTGLCTRVSDPGNNTKIPSQLWTQSGRVTMDTYIQSQPPGNL